MATTLVHEPPAARVPAGDGVRFVAVRANLLPDEIVSARQFEVVRKQVSFGLVVVVGLLIAWFGLSWWQTALANSDKDDAQHRTIALQQQQGQFGPLVQAQGETSTIHDQLRSLMAGDLSWTRLLARLRTDAPAGVALTNVTGSVTPVTGTPGDAGSTSEMAPLNQTGKGSIGELTISGSAGSKSAIAAFADTLGHEKGLATPLITSVAAAGKTVTFTLTAVLTTDALGGRFSTPAAAGSAPTGGK